MKDEKSKPKKTKKRQIGRSYHRNRVVKVIIGSSGFADKILKK